MIAYRAEIAMANLLRETIARSDEVRSLLRGIDSSEADLIPDYEQGTLTVKLHYLANHSYDEVIQKSCDEFNCTETIFPRTNLRLIYKLGSTHDPENITCLWKFVVGLIKFINKKDCVSSTINKLILRSRYLEWFRRGNSLVAVWIISDLCYRWFSIGGVNSKVRLRNHFIRVFSIKR